jgi:hypothetical protein
MIDMSGWVNVNDRMPIPDSPKEVAPFYDTDECYIASEVEWEGSHRRKVFNEPN